jgi:hypothetical protein
MKVYLHGSGDDNAGKVGPVARHGFFVCPAGHRPKDCPAGEQWWENSGDGPKPREFFVEFVRGEAEVEDPLGKYLVENGLAQPTRYVRKQEWQ